MTRTREHEFVASTVDSSNMHLKANGLKLFGHGSDEHAL